MIRRSSDGRRRWQHRRASMSPRAGPSGPSPSLATRGCWFAPPAFSPDGTTLYFSNSIGQQLLAYRVDPATGRLSERRKFAALDDAGGLPDGLCVDREGSVWWAVHGGGRVLHLTPGGQIDRVVEVPAANTTSCCLSGEDLRTLFITSGEWKRLWRGNVRGGGGYSGSSGTIVLRSVKQSQVALWHKCHDADEN